MIYRSHRIALLAAATFGVVAATHQVSAQTEAVSPLRAPAETSPQKLSPETHSRETRLPDAQFGAVRVDESRAASFGDLVSSENIERQIRELNGPLFFREGSLGFYDVSFEATGNRSDGQVRVMVTIVGQSDGQTILARGQGVQQWQNSRWLIPAPIPQTRTPQSPPSPDVYPPIPAAPKATSARILSPRATFLAFCADSEREQDGNSKAAKVERAREEAKRADESKSEDKPKIKPATKSAPDPNPRRNEDAKAKPATKSAPDPNPPTRANSNSNNDSRGNDSRGNDSKRRRDSDSPSRPRLVVPTFPSPRPQFPDKPRSNAPDPNPPTRGNAPDPNPPSSGTVNIGPNPNPPARGGVYQEPRPSRRPVWNDPYGRYPYPYPYPVPYPYPYPVPYPAPSYPTPRTPTSDQGARQAFDYALLQARAQAEADFAWQLRGEPMARNF